MKILVIVMSLMTALARADEPSLEDARRVARQIHSEIQEKHPFLRDAVVGTGRCNPQTFEPANGTKPSIPCIYLYARSDTMAEQLKAIYGSGRDGIRIVHRHMSPGRAVAFGIDHEDFGEETVQRKIERELESILEKHPGVSSVGMGLAPLSVMISVADPETERILMEEYPPGALLHDVPVKIARDGVMDARDPVVSQPCEPALTRTPWEKVKRRLKRWLGRPLR